MLSQLYDPLISQFLSASKRQPRASTDRFSTFSLFHFFQKISFLLTLPTDNNSKLPPQSQKVTLLQIVFQLFHFFTFSKKYSLYIQNKCRQVTQDTLKFASPDFHVP